MRRFSASRAMLALVVLVTLVGPGPAAAQPAAAVAATRRTSVTWLGDTGLWFTPTAAVLGHRALAVTTQRVNFDREPGFSDISHALSSVAVGVGGRAEIFGSVRFQTRIDRDARPIFSDVPSIGGPVNEYPFVSSPFTGSARGDAIVGAKLVLVPQRRLGFSALAVRGLVKLPVGDTRVGASTGEPDLQIDGILSQMGRAFEFAFAVGYVRRADPVGADLSNGVSWGFGLTGPVTAPAQFLFEMNGEGYLSDRLRLATPVTAIGGERSAPTNELRSWVELVVGGQWNGPRGLFVSAGVTWNALQRTRTAGNALSANPTSDPFGLIFRIGVHPGVTALDRRR